MLITGRARLALLGVTACACFLFGSSVVDAQAALLRFQPVADAHVSKAKRKANFGPSKRLVVDGSPIVTSYLRFNVRGLPGTVSYAYLELSVFRASGGKISVRRAAVNHWDERRIRFRNAPRRLVGPTARARSVKSFRVQKIDVTKLVRGNGPITLVLTARGRGGLTFASGESISVLRPNLIVGVNEAPLCKVLSLKTSEDTATTGDPDCTDAERDRLSYRVVSQGKYGTASIADGKLGYQPKSNYWGIDRFEYIAHDGRKASRRSTVIVTVTPVNDAPTCESRTIVVNEDAGAAAGAACSDVDNDSLHVTVISSAKHGKAWEVGNELRYEAGPNFHGTDSFTYRAKDTTLPSAPATVSVTVVPVNDAPTCNPVGSVTDEDAPHELDPSCSDIDGDPLAYGIAGQGARGAASISLAKLRYTPSPNVTGGDNFMYVATDGAAWSAPAAASMEILPVNDTPVCSDVALATHEEVLGEQDPACTDFDGDPLTYEIVGQGSKGTASVGASKLRYVPNVNASGPDSFTYRATDGTLISAAATVAVTIRTGNDLPVCQPVSLTTGEDAPAERDPSCTDIDGDTLTYEIVDQALRGTASVSGGRLRYVPNANANGADSFTYRAFDGTGAGAPVTVTVEIVAVNDAPVCDPLLLDIGEDTAGEVGPSCSDVEGDPLSYSIVSQGSRGTASVSAGKLRFVPNGNVNGADTFTYRAHDALTASAATTVSVTISPVNDAPTCANVTLAMSEDTPGEREPACTDIDGDVLAYSIVAQGAKGAASVGAGRLRYVPSANANGADSFTYLASDGVANSGAATVGVSIAAVNDVPACANVSLATNEDLAGEQNPVCTDIDGDTLTYSTATQGSRGAASVVGGKLRYVPNPNAHGSDSFTYQASDGALTSPVATVSVTIQPVNDTPVCSGLTLATNEDEPGEQNPSCSDVDGDVLTYAIATQATKGGASVTAASKLRFVPNANANGSDSFTYRANDGAASSSPAQVSVTVAAVNDAPVCSGINMNIAQDGLGTVNPNCSDVEGSALTYAIATQPTKGLARVTSGGQLEYDPNPGATGTDSFTYTARDGALTSAPATVSVSIGNVNDPPVCSARTLTVTEDGTPGTVAPSCTDPENDPLTYSIAAQGGKGTASVVAGELRYVPNANANGSDTFTYRASDGALTSAAATVSVTITPVNDAPVCTNVALTTDEDAIGERDPACSDVDGDLLSYSIVAQGAKGTASIAAGRLRYTPNANANGSDSFTYLARDAAVASAVATVSVTITPVNDAPVCASLTLATNEDVTAERDPSCSDVDGDPLTYSIFSQGGKGAASVVADRLRYTPNANANGSDSFTYRAHDGAAQSAGANVAVTITALNDAPVCSNVSLVTNEDVTGVRDPVCSDVDGDALTYSVVTQGAKGSASIADGKLSYAPATNANGPDSFTYLASDAALSSAAATVSVTITAVNDAPACANLSLTTNEDVIGERDPACTDIDGDTLTYGIVSQGGKGTASVSGGRLRYAPDLNANGTDSFTYRASDGTGVSPTAGVSVTIAPVNDAPVCNSVSRQIDQDGNITIPPNCTDVEGNALTYSIATNPANGTASVDNSGSGPLRYIANPGWSGGDSFTYRASDGNATGAPATVTITVNDVNDPPVCEARTLILDEDAAAATVAPVCSDPEGNQLTYSIPPGGQGSKGTASVNSGQLRYAPNANVNGADSFTYVASDGALTSAPATVSVTIRPVNDPPVCNAVSLTTAEDAAGERDPSCSDVDGDAMTYSIAAQGNKGSASIATGKLRYVPSANANGTDSFTYRANDGTVDSLAASASVTITPVNDAPVCQPLTLTTSEDVPAEVNPSCSDIDGDTLSYSIVGQGTKGVASVATGRLRYAPATNLTGDDSFTYRAHDAATTSAAAQVSVTINAVNDAPACSDRSLTVDEDTTGSVPPLCTDAEGDPISLSIASSPTKGTASIVAGELRYSPNTNVNGSDSFAYRASDGSVSGAPATVSVTVRAVNDAPVCADVTLVTGEDAPGERDPSCSDVDGDGLTYSIVAQGPKGTASVVAARLRYAPNLNINGSDSFTYRASDGGLLSAAASVAVTIVPVNDAPVCSAVSLTTAEETSGETDPSCSDVDGDSLTYSIAAQGAKGTASVIAAKLRYAPSLNATGGDTFTYRASDGALSSAPANVSVTITPVNDAPACANVSFATDEDVAGEGDPVCADVDGDTLAYAIASQPANGTASVVAGQLRYVPNLNTNGSDTFTYRASDGIVASAAATATVTVRPVNDAPVCTNVNLVTSEDASGETNPACTDVDGDPLTYQIASQGARGTASVVAGKLSYQPNPNITGTDSFTYTARDASRTTAPATVSVTIGPANDAPVCAGLSLTTSEDTSAERDPSCTDIDTDPLTYSIDTQGAKGTASVVAGKLRYAPNANANGTDSFTYRAHDGIRFSAPATVSVTITAVNDRPVCADIGLVTDEEVAGERDPSCTDADGDSLTLSIFAQGTKGTASMAGSKLRYVPRTNLNGADSFTYRADDGAEISVAATVSVTIRPVNDVPQCTDVSFATDEDVLGERDPACTDIDGDALNYSIVLAPSHGTASVAGGKLQYLSNLNRNGSDSFTYRAGDGAASSVPATATVSIAPVNDAPACAAVTLTANEDGSGEATPNCSDVEGDAITHSIVTQGAKGTVSLVSGKLRYVPLTNVNGSDSFTYRASDAALDGAAATVSVTITPVNDAPVCSGVTLRTDEDVAGETDPACSDIDGDALTYSIASQGTKGSASVGGAKVRYAPSLNANGPDSFTYRAHDAAGQSAAAPVSVTIAAVNDAPACPQQSLTIDEDGEGTLTPECTDPEGDQFTLEIAGHPLKGSASVPAAGTLRYVGAPNANGPDSFTYRARDAELAGAPATVAVTIRSINDAPVCAAVSLTTFEDVAAERDPACADIDNDALTYAIASAASQGMASVVSGRLRYAPNLNTNGLDSFTYKAMDGAAESNAAAVNVTVNAANDAPVAQDVSASTPEDTAKALTLSASDVDGDSLTFTVVSGPAHGVLAGTGANRTFTPDANYHGSDSFTYRAGDGVADSNLATVSLTVTSVNDAPVAQDLSASTPEDTPKQLTLNASDADGDGLTFTIVSAPSNGVLSGTGANRTYTPNANYNGPDSFTYRASDGAADSNLATVSLTVEPVNDAPTCASLPVTIDEDGSGTVTPVCTDPDGDQASAEIVNQPLKGSALVDGGVIRYTASPNANGADSFTYRGSDGQHVGAPATVSVTIRPVNDAPACAELSFATAEDTARELDPLCTEVDGDALTYSIVAAASNGTATVTGGRKLRYVPNLNFAGSDSFTYKANDGTVDSNVATVAVTVNPVNDAPVAQNGSVSTAEDTAAAVSLGASDVEGSPLSFTIVSGPAHGVLTGTGASRTYIPDANYFGSDSFTFRANDGSADSNVASVSLTVTPVNDAPVAQGVSVSTPEDTPKVVSLSASDVDGDALTYTVVSDPAHGTLSGTGANRTYTPNANYLGPDSFTFQSSDGALESNVATVSVTVNPVNDAPTCPAQTMALDEDTSASITPVCADVEGDAVSLEIVSGPAKGSASVDAGALRYVAAPNANGGDSFTYRARDVHGAAGPAATVTVTIQPANDAPACANLSLTTAEDTAGEVTPVCTEIDGDALTYSISSQGAKGTASVVGGRLRYVPDLNVTGSDSFTYEAHDGTAASAAATVTVTISAVNDAPVCSALELTTDEDTAAERDPICTDVENDTLSYSIGSPASKGTASVAAGRLRYTPNLNATGGDSFTYRAHDASANSAAATVTVTINPLNDAPVCSARTMSLAEDAAGATVMPACTDPEGDALTYSIAGQGTKGTADVAAGELRYVPNPNENGADSFTYRASDAGLVSVPATVSVTITAVNDTPVCSDVALTTTEDVAAERDPTCSDIDGDGLTFSIVSQGAKGTASIAAGKLRFVPSPNATGDDSFTYRAGDGLASSAPATVTVSITPVNDAPACQSSSLALDEDSSGSLTPVCSDPEGDAVTLEIVDQAAKGSASVDAGMLRYAPTSNANGDDSFTYRGRDAHGVVGAAATVNVTIRPVNDAPSCANLSLTTVEDVAGEVAPVCTEIDGDTLTYSIVGAAANGLATVANGKLRYVPGPSFNGSDSFTYQAHDGTAPSGAASVSVTVTPVNDAPVAQNLTATTEEDSGKALALSASDVDGDALTYSIESGPAHGTLTGAAPNVTYTPNADYNGSDSFSYRASDSATGSNTATVELTVTAVNDAPVANDVTATTAEDTAKTVALVASDVDGDVLTYTIVTPPAHGTLSGSGPDLTYAPAANFHGVDTFTYLVSDGSNVQSGVATVRVTVAPANDAPVAQDLSATTPEDTAKGLLLSASDVDGDALTYTIVSGPAHGTLSGTAPNVTYTPNANYNGSDSFSYRASDSATGSNTATVELTVTAVNDAPVANDVTATTAEDTASAVALVASDDDGDALAYTIVAAPAHGTLSGSGANRTYTPGANYHGPDSFTYKATDGSGADSSIATVGLTISAVNDLPVCPPLSMNLDEDASAAVTPVCTDVEGDAVTLEIASQGAKGTASLVGGGLHYAASPNANGTDSFTYRGSDGSGAGPAAAVSVAINPVNDAPAAHGQSVSTPEDTAKAVTLGATDVDGDALTFTIVSGPTNGTLTGTGADRIYTPAANFFGDDSFTFKATDGVLETEVATVSITVIHANDPPSAGDVSESTLEDTAKVITLSGNDADGNPISYEIVSGPVHGTLTGDGGSRTYIPAPDYSGSDSFTYRVVDGFADSGPATVSLTVTPVNDPPSCQNRTLTTDEDVTAELDASCNDVDSASLAYEIAGQGSKGTASAAGRRLRYVPARNANGSDSFTYRASDGSATSPAATVSLTIHPRNDAPTCSALSLAIDEDTDGFLAPACSDPEGDPVTVTIASQPQNGTVSYSGGQFRYIPFVDFHGSDSFTYRASDGSLAGAAAAVSVTVRSVNDEPEAVPVDATTSKGVAHVVTLSGFDYDNDALTFQIISLPANGALRAGPNATDHLITAAELPYALSGTNSVQVRYEPATGYTGVNTFEFRAHDGTAVGLPAEVRISVIGANTAPTCSNKTLAVDEDVELWDAVACSDPDNDPLTYTRTGPSHGQVTIFDNGSFNYAPDPNYNGTDSFTVQARDPSGRTSAVATVTISVASVNDAPTCRSFTLVTTEDTPGLRFPDCDDADGQALTYTIVGHGTKGTASVEPDGRFRYAPNANENGADSFTFTVSDGIITTSGQTAEVSITAVNDAPVCRAVGLTTQRDTAGTIFPDCEDADGNTLSYEIVTAPANGTASVAGPQLSYVPAAGYAGPDSFTYRANDGTVFSAAATVSVTVTP